MARNLRILPQIETLEARWMPALITPKLAPPMHLPPTAAPQADVPPGQCLPAAGNAQAGSGAWSPGSWGSFLPAVQKVILNTWTGKPADLHKVGDPDINKIGDPKELGGVSDPDELFGVTFGGTKPAATPGPDDDIGNPELGSPEELSGLGAFFAKFGK